MSDSSQSQPPGWYYAQGDPPDTQRYWDGNAWQGDPQPVPGAGQTAPSAAAMADAGSLGVTADAMAGGRAPAEPGQRFIAYLIDLGIVFAALIVIVIISAIFGAISDALGGIVLLLGYLGIFGFNIYNWVVLQGSTGQTYGKKQQGIYLLSSETMQPVGPGQAVLRWLFQALLGALCWIPALVDAIFILSKPDNKRFSDDMLKMHVYK